MTTATSREAARQTSSNQPVQDRIKILLVDDTPENLVSLEAALDGLGQDLVLANSGMEALRHLLEEDFAAILLSGWFVWIHLKKRKQPGEHEHAH